MSTDVAYLAQAGLRDLTRLRHVLSAAGIEAHIVRPDGAGGG